MRNYRNNNPKRNRFRSIDRNYKRNGESKKFDNEVSNNLNFRRTSPGKNNHNASKLVEKYNDLAREALSYGDKILSENYFQHADHFLRVLSEQENLKLNKPIDKNKVEKSNESINTEKVSEQNT
tara:strand:- start:428 stop:799 length:372 start_codon:yes stop_codon:yes gene_type:complete